MRIILIKITDLKKVRNFKKIFITGIIGSGGSYLAEHIKKKNRKVKIFGCYRNKNYKILKKLNSKKIQASYCDLNNFSKLNKLIKKIKPDLVYHLASNADVRLSFDQPEKIIINNNNITINLFHSLRKLSYQPLIILCSTSELYGALDAKLKIDENFKIKPDNPYAVSKTFQDFLAQNYSSIYGMKIIITRMFTYLNPRRLNLFSSNWAHQIAQIEFGKRKYLFHGNLNSTRTILDIEDAMEAYWLAAKKGKIGEIYNIGGTETYKISKILKILKSLSTKKIISKLDKKLLRKKDVKFQIPNSKKFIKDTGWKIKKNVRQSLKNLLNSQRTSLND